MNKKITLASVALILTGIADMSVAAPYKAPKNQVKVYFDLENFIAPDLHVDFNDYTYALDLDPENQSAQLDIKINADALSSNIKVAESRIKSANMLDVANHKYITFKSIKVNYSGETLKSATGDLTIRGITRPAQFTSNNFKCTKNTTTNKKTCSATFVGTVDRTAYGITRPSVLGYSKNLVITFDVKGVVEQ